MYFVLYNDGWIILRKTFYISNITNILTLYINAMKHDHKLYVNGRKEYEYYDGIGLFVEIKDIAFKILSAPHLVTKI